MPVLLDADMQISLTFDGDMDVSVTEIDGEFGEIQYVSSAEVYPGETTVIPSQSRQVLMTSGYLMPSNVTVEPIPWYYGLITWNGSVLTVS